ncbi:5-formyltetrahydrofolate cyclo-ligase [Virgibacillus sp. C22-A2]|uniref:5-formyltetrahydrofolate cyclo-ligase n=1 Tax=Virgibacillus tibetensis TaxID=3042313 RepID=A0ABU6KAG7_9BACI|nr:5-formyltetrahydrofolate cyclo-ligase [Virgibacillus sp. C22-A2]
MNKKELRKSAIATLRTLPASDRESIENQLTHRLVKSSIWLNASTIGITMAQGFEWDTKKIIETAWSQNKDVCVPKCNPLDKSLTFYLLESYDQLEKVYYNLLEPKPKETKEVDKRTIDLLVVPGLLFDKKGFRIGFGGGYYDRFLQNFPNETVSIFSKLQLVDELPRESFDIAVDHLITEQGCIN